MDNGIFFFEPPRQGDTLKTHPKEERKEFVGCKSSNGCSLRKGKKTTIPRYPDHIHGLRSGVLRVKQRSKPLF